MLAVRAGTAYCQVSQRCVFLLNSYGRLDMVTCVDIGTYRRLQSLIQRWQLFHHEKAWSTLEQMGTQSFLSPIFLDFFRFFFENCTLREIALERWGGASSSHGTLGTKQAPVTWSPCRCHIEVRRRPLCRKKVSENDARIVNVLVISLQCIYKLHIWVYITLIGSVSLKEDTLWTVGRS